jgi:hypothetical protein
VFLIAGLTSGFVARARRPDKRRTTLPSRSLKLRLGQCVLPALLTIPAAHAPAPWERAVRGTYENRGIAQIEKLGDRWVVSVHCDGTHTTYLDDTRVDLARYARGYVACATTTPTAPSAIRNVFARRAHP